MQYNPKKHHRKSIRLKDYDYSQAGYYFVTICTHAREQLLGKIENGKMILNEFGEILQDELLSTETIRSNIKIDYFQIMPNHIHFIIIIKEQYINYEIVGKKSIVGVHCNEPLLQNTEQFGKSTKNSIPTIVKLTKSSTTKRINEIRNSPGIPVWQRNYFEHIIRNEKELFEIRKYIEYNPLNWKDDEYNKP